MFARRVLLGVASLALATPALAQPSVPPPPPGVVDAQGNVYDGPMPDNRPEWRGAPPQMGLPGQPPIQPGQPGVYPPGWEQARADWLTQCRRNHGSGNKVGGTVVGGLIGGVIGNRVAGRGDRVVGTVVGAGVGAVAGGAIGDGADKRTARDWCESYLEQHTSWGQGYQQGFGQPVVGYGYAPMMVMMPVAYVQVQGQTQPRECKETVVYEDYVTTTTPARYRTVTSYTRVPDKRVRIIPDKRVRSN
jgi:hypothetical protein